MTSAVPAGSGAVPRTGHTRPLVWLLLAAGVLVFVLGELLFALNEFDGDGAAFGETWFLLLSSLAVTLIGVLILSRVAGHRIGWLLYAIGLLLSGSYFLDEYAIYAVVTSPDSLPLGREAAVVETIGATAFGLLAGFLFLLFPDGRPQSPRWQKVMLVSAVALVGLTFGNLFRPGTLGEPFNWENPFGIEGSRDAFAAVSLLSLITVAAIGIASLASLVMRFRRSEGIERRQLEWVFFGGAFFAVCMLLTLPLQIAGERTSAYESLLFSVGFTAIPVTVAIAILRYRLYDIDWIINRTLVYVPLTGILAGVYVAMTGLLRTLFTDLTDWGSDAAIAMSTLLVAGSLTPLKNWLQALVDRRFKETPNPEKEARRLASQARDVIEVLQREVFLRKYLRELIVIFGARGGAIRIGYSTLAEGEWLGDDALVIELVCEGEHRGHIGLAPRISGLEYSDSDRERFATLAEVVAEVISIGSLLQPVVSLEGMMPEPRAALPAEEPRRLN
jgi:hypothetical protein